MFTGIISHKGTIANKGKDSLSVSIPKPLLSKLKKGGSIAVNGACLTVVTKSTTAFRADILPETWKRTMYSDFKIGDVVNLELPLKHGSSLDGHIVQGHVDGTGKLLSIEKKNTTYLLTFTAGKDILKFLVEKGSVALNGVSLTVVHVSKKYFSVAIIPHTWNVTNLSQIQKGERINIEVDVLAKYAQKQNGKKKTKN